MNALSDIHSNDQGTECLMIAEGTYLILSPIRMHKVTYQQTKIMKQLQCLIYRFSTYRDHTWPSAPINSVSIASRVVPLIGLTIVLSSPTNAFKMLLLPTLGRPTIAIAGT